MRLAAKHAICCWDVCRVASLNCALTFTVSSWSIAGAPHCPYPENFSLLSAKFSASPVITLLSLIADLKLFVVSILIGMCVHAKIPDIETVQKYLLEGLFITLKRRTEKKQSTGVVTNRSETNRFYHLFWGKH